MMKAARWHNARDIRIEEVPVPAPKPDEVKIKTAWAGICGSDLHEYIAGPIFIPSETPHPVSGEVAPITMGHEFSGVVVEVGDNVSHVAIGDNVVVEPILACGTCVACLHGKYNLCNSLGFQGLAGGGGGFAPFVTAAGNRVHKMPEGLSLEQGALVEPAAVALHAVRISKLRAGDEVAVFGAGPIGLLLVEALVAAGAGKIHVVEISPQRAAKAIELGATSAINPLETDPVQKIRELSPGGVDVAFEVTGVPAVLQQSIDATNYEGETIIVSIWESEAAFQPNTVVLKERNVKGSIAYRDIFPAVMELMTRGVFSAERLVTKKIKLDQIVAEGFETLVNEKDQIKILVDSQP